MSYKTAVNKILKRLLGIQVKVISKNNFYNQQVIELISYNDVDHVFDIGANKGQYALELLSSGFKGNIISVEPLEGAYFLLQQAAFQHSNWTIHERAAVGAIETDVSINVSKNTASSSILPMDAKHAQAALGSEYVDVESVKQITLSSLLKQYDYRNAWLKIDTQGYEMQVLATIEAARLKPKFIELEVSTVELYTGQHLLEEIYARLSKLGYKLCAGETTFIDPASCETLQFDLVFKRV